MRRTACGVDPVSAELHERNSGDRRVLAGRTGALKKIGEAGNRDGTPVEFGKRIRSGWVLLGMGGGGGAGLDGGGYV